MAPVIPAASETQIDPVASFLETVQEGDVSRIEESLDGLTASDQVRALLNMGADDQEKLLHLVDPKLAADVVEELPQERAAEIIERLDAKTAASILEEMDSADQADVFSEMHDAEAEAIYSEMAPDAAEDVRKLAEYPSDTAGGLMSTDVFTFVETETVGTILRRVASEDEDFERYRGQHPYILDAEGRLVGVVSLRTLITSKRSVPLKDVMVAPLSVSPLTELGDLEDVFDDYPFLGIPVVDEAGRMIGTVSRTAVSDASLHRAEDDALKMQGVVGDEIRSMPTLLRARRRLSWLTVNIGLNIVAASVIALYEETLTAVIALAVFLPIVSDMSGCSGNQAVAVTMRELSLGLARPVDIVKVWLKEITVGAINGLVLGILIGLAAWAWRGNAWIGVVVGVALAVNTLVAVSIGGTVPLALKRFNVDPAVASGPMLTTITDMVGFFLVLSLASAMLPLL
ncbi:magnesium transporter [Breoghania sp. L-A4]|uniref:magnesium transporter n=1 Tax=Breoghania sp. L-A4 TaxID=2304600 RepID=UPI000E35D7EE|nr:magnesium transporter [Breoghania sp. L-A4]AXS38771.1 magnesium transporter [Breoghania sp. L-A4]